MKIWIAWWDAIDDVGNAPAREVRCKVLKQSLSFVCLHSPACCPTEKKEKNQGTKRKRRPIIWTDRRVCTIDDWKAIYLSYSNITWRCHCQLHFLFHSWICKSRTWCQRGNVLVFAEKAKVDSLPKCSTVDSLSTALLVQKAFACFWYTTAVSPTHSIPCVVVQQSLFSTLSNHILHPYSMLTSFTQEIGSYGNCQPRLYGKTDGWCHGMVFNADPLRWCFSVTFDTRTASSPCKPSSPVLPCTPKSNDI